MKDNNWTKLDKIVVSVVGLGKENAIKLSYLNRVIDSELGAGTSKNIGIGDYVDWAEKGFPLMRFNKGKGCDMICFISNEAEKEEWLNKIDTMYETVTATLKQLVGDKYKSFPDLNDLLRLEHVIRKIEV